MRKFTLIAIMALFSAFSLKAQLFYNLEKQPDYEKELLGNEEFFEKAELITEIEGKSVKTLGTYDSKGKHYPRVLYDNYSVKVKSVYKGNPELAGTVIAIIQDCYLEPFGPEGTRNLAFGGRSYSYILFLMKSDRPINPDKAATYPKHRYQPLQDKKEAMLESFQDGPIRGLNKLIFYNRIVLYQYMSQYEGIIIPPYLPEPEPETTYNPNDLDPIAQLVIMEKLMIASPEQVQHNTLNWNFLLKKLDEPIYDSRYFQNFNIFDPAMKQMIMEKAAQSGSRRPKKDTTYLEFFNIKFKEQEKIKMKEQKQKSPKKL